MSPERHLPDIVRETAVESAAWAAAAGAVGSVWHGAVAGAIAPVLASLGNRLLSRLRAEVGDDEIARRIDDDPALGELVVRAALAAGAETDHLDALGAVLRDGFLHVLDVTDAEALMRAINQLSPEAALILDLLQLSSDGMGWDRDLARSLDLSLSRTRGGLRRLEEVGAAEERDGVIDANGVADDGSGGTRTRYAVTAFGLSLLKYIRAGGAE